MSNNINIIRFLQNLKNERVTVEMRQGLVVEGDITHVDISMNMHLRKVRVTVPGKGTMKTETMVIRGNNVRYVILPPALPLEQYLMEERTKKPKARPHSDKPRSLV